MHLYSISRRQGHLVHKLIDITHSAVCHLAVVPPGVGKMSQSATALFNSLDPDLKAKVLTLDSVSAEIEMDRSIRLWRIAAKKVRYVICCYFGRDLRELLARRSDALFLDLLVLFF